MSECESDRKIRNELEDGRLEGCVSMRERTRGGMVKKKHSALEVSQCSLLAKQMQIGGKGKKKPGVHIA